MSIETILISHSVSYPDWQIRDVYKLIHQALSEGYKKHYRPTYRVIWRKYMPVLAGLTNEITKNY